jgi:hypothetical protein
MYANEAAPHTSQREGAIKRAGEKIVKEMKDDALDTRFTLSTGEKMSEADDFTSLNRRP